MKRKCAVFDFDGTLFDSMGIWETLGERYLREQGIMPEETLSETIREMSLLQAADYFQKKYGLSRSTEEILNGLNYMVRDFYFYEVLPKPGATDFLKQLKEVDIRLCIATASDRNSIEAALRRCGMDKLFDRIFTCTEIGHGKDEPHIFREAAAFYRADRSEAFVFEDALHAARTAHEDGFPVVGVYDESEARQEELKELCVWYLPDFLHTEDFLRFASA